VDYLKELAKYVKTQKQKIFDFDFLKNADKYEVWDEIDFNRESTSKITYEVTLEDLKSYAEGALDTNPLFVDEDYAKKSVYGEIISHPNFSIVILFWCLREGIGDWIRTPGSINPGHRWEFYEPFRVGDIIRVKTKPYDRWIKRGRHYLTYQMDFIDQNDRLKQRYWCTLILPKTRADVAKIMKGEHVIEA